MQRHTIYKEKEFRFKQVLSPKNKCEYHSPSLGCEYIANTSSEGEVLFN